MASTRQEMDPSLAPDTLSGDGPSPKLCLRNKGMASSSPLENLPAELRDQILSHIPDLPTLRALVKSSPIMHAQYRANRDHLLRACLGRELDGFFVDAYGCLKSRVSVMGRFRTDTKIINFASMYRNRLAEEVRRSVRSIRGSAVRWLSAYHVAVVRPLARRYIAWALENLWKGLAPEDADNGEQGDVKLSRSEEIRIHRAIYRYGIFCHLFGQNPCERIGMFLQHEINELFFGLFDPWDAEAVGCIELFVRERYEQILAKVKPDLGPVRIDRYLNPEKVVHLDDEYEDYLEGTISRGPKTIVRVLAIKENQDHAALVAKIQAVLMPRAGDFTMRYALSSKAQRDRDYRSHALMEPPTASMTARMEAQERRDPVEFGVDGVPPKGPPLAWVLLWGGKYANIYGEYVPESLRRWGYVMWDEQRWTDLGARDLVAKQWETARHLAEQIKEDYGWSPVDIECEAAVEAQEPGSDDTSQS